MAAEVDAGQAREAGVENALRRVVANEKKLLGGIGEVDFLSVNLHFTRFEAVEPKGGEGENTAVV